MVGFVNNTGPKGSVASVSRMCLPILHYNSALDSHILGNSANKTVKTFILGVTLPWVTLPPIIVHRQDQIATQKAYVQPNILPDPIVVTQLCLCVRSFCNFPFFRLNSNSYALRANLKVD